MATIYLNLHNIDDANTVLQLFTARSEGVPTSTLYLPTVEAGQEDRAVRTYLTAWRAGEVDTDIVSFKQQVRYLEAATLLVVTRGRREVSRYIKDDTGRWNKQ